MDDMNRVRRKNLIRTANANRADSAHIKFMLCRLNRGRMPLRSVLSVCTKQGFTPSTSRNMLAWMEDSSLIQYDFTEQGAHVYVKLTDLGKEIYANEVRV